jgi:cation diffusion facilitator family transporter
VKEGRQDRADVDSERSMARTREAADSKRTVLIALAANAVIAIAKLFGGLVSGSSSMLAEAGHSIADTTNQAFLLVSITLSVREPTPKRPFGSGQERFLWSFLAAVGMFVAGSLFAVGFGTYELLKGGEEVSPALPLAILGVSLLAEGTSWVRAFRQTRGEAQEADRSIWRYIRETRDPNVKMVLVEDTAALLGIVIAAAGIILDSLTGAKAFDPSASIVIGGLLVSLAVWLARDSKHLLIGASARPDEREAIESVIESHDEVVEVVQLLTMVLGPKAVLVAARVNLEDGVDAGHIERLAGEIDDELREQIPDITEVFLDPTSGSPAQ